MKKIKNIFLAFTLLAFNTFIYAQEREELLREIPSLNTQVRASQKGLNSAADQNFDSGENDNGQAQEMKPVPPVKNSKNMPSSSYSYVWISLLFGIAFVGTMGMGRFLFIRLVGHRKGPSSSAHHSNKMMGVISSLELSPKRQILLVRIREKEVALASTEAGISLLCDVVQPSPFQVQSDVEKTKKQDVLLKALQSIGTETQKEKKVPFSQYLASAFEKEAKKEAAENIETPSATALIREKLKTMRALS